MKNKNDILKKSLKEQNIEFLADKNNIKAGIMIQKRGKENFYYLEDGIFTKNISLGEIFDLNSDKIFEIIKLYELNKEDIRLLTVTRDEKRNVNIKKDVTNHYKNLNLV
ncbi:MAG: hypothetical protein ACOCP8_02510 [archaeon]